MLSRYTSDYNSYVMGRTAVNRRFVRKATKAAEKKLLPGGWERLLRILKRRMWRIQLENPHEYGQNAAPAWEYRSERPGGSVACRTYVCSVECRQCGLWRIGLDHLLIPDPRTADEASCGPEPDLGGSHECFFRETARGSSVDTRVF
jgi:hypothetical protein